MSKRLQKVHKMKDEVPAIPILIVTLGVTIECVYFIFYLWEQLDRFDIFMLSIAATICFLMFLSWFAGKIQGA